MRLFSSQFILLVLVIVAIFAIEASAAIKSRNDVVHKVVDEDSEEDNTKILKKRKKESKIEEDSDEKISMSKKNRKPIYKDDSSDERPERVTQKAQKKKTAYKDSSDERPERVTQKPKKKKTAYKDSTEESDDETPKKTETKKKRKSNLRGVTWSENVPVYGDENYCEILDYGNKHIACKYTIWKPEPACAEESEYIDMDDLKDLIIKIHNKKRNLVAGGNLGNLKPAVRMATMQWDRTLHITATIKAKLCSMQPDNCHGTTRFPYSGQNIGMFMYGGAEDRYGLDYIVKNRLEGWFGEHANCTKKIIKSFPQPENKVGLFTIMVREENDYVGCGMNYFKQDGLNRFIFVCHYASNNFIGIPVYKAGEEAGSECKTGTNMLYKNLCSTSEVYKYGST